MKKPRLPIDPFAALDRLNKDWWILDEQHNPKAVSIREWAQWYEAAARKGQADGKVNDPRRVASTETATMWVSTVFLGTNHNWMGSGPPIIFETMVFSREKFPREFEGKIRWHRDDFEQLRYATWDDAETGHKTMVRRIRKLEADALAGVGKTRAARKEENGRS